MRVYDKKFIIYCYGEHWHINWLKNSNVTLEEFFKEHDVEMIEWDSSHDGGCPSDCPCLDTYSRRKMKPKEKKNE